MTNVDNSLADDLTRQCPHCGKFYKTTEYHVCDLPLQSAQWLQCQNCGAWYMAGSNHSCFQDIKLDFGLTGHEQKVEDLLERIATALEKLAGKGDQ